MAVIAEIRAAPGRNLLRLLGETSLIGFAAGIAGPDADRYQALTAIRRYTHPIPGERPKWPTPGTVAKWAKALDVPWTEFYARTP